MTEIHPTAIVHEMARIGRDVKIGPYSIVEAETRIGDGCELASHVVVRRGVTLGRKNRVAEGVVLGGPPQHVRLGSEFGRVAIGDGNTIREYVTINCALKPSAETVVGNDNMIMANVHVGHDCHIGDSIVIVNSVMLAGHVQIHDFAFIGGGAGIHQFCRVGSQSMVGGLARVCQDVPPFVLIDGESNRVVGLNTVGLRRRGFSRDDLSILKSAYRTIYRTELDWQSILAKLHADHPSGPAAEFPKFLSHGTRGFVQERRLSRRTLRVVAPPESSSADTIDVEDRAA